MARAPAVELAPGLWRLRLLGDWINGFVLRDDDGQVTLVDFGLKKSPDKITSALDYIGLSVHDVTRLLLTHAHSDHAGGAAEMARRTGRSIDVHVDDASYLRSGEVPRRDQTLRLGRLLNRLPGGGFEPAPVGTKLSDGKVLPIGGGVRVVHTPGHSPGHISLLHEQSQVLITGDALFNFRGVGWSVPFFCTDFALSQQTAQRFADLDFDLAAFTHGPEIRDRARQQVGELLATLTRR